MGKIKTSKKSLTIPGPALSESEFSEMVKQAEQGPFHTMQEAAQIIDNWKSKFVK